MAPNGVKASQQVSAKSVGGPPQIIDDVDLPSNVLLAQRSVALRFDQVLTMLGAMDLGVTDDGERAGHEQAAQIAVTLFGDKRADIFVAEFARDTPRKRNELSH